MKTEIKELLNEAYSTGCAHSEICLDPKGNTYCGPIAQLFVSRLKLPKVYQLDDSSFHVFEVMEDGAVIHRASQSTRAMAQSYMTPSRVCVYRSGSY